MAKERLDQLLLKRNLAENLQQARAMIMAKKVRVNEQYITTPGSRVEANASVAVKMAMPYVSRGGYKLEAALKAFAVNPTGYICADVGASTGGFTDVLLQNGASKVYAIDVGYGILAWKLRQDKRVVVMERTNARKLESLPEPISLAVIDASFISLKLILPAVVKWLVSQATIIALIKPQFEAPRDKIESGGVITNPQIHAETLLDILSWCEQNNLPPLNLIASPITGPAGNREFLLHLGNQAETASYPPAQLIERCL